MLIIGGGQAGIPLAHALAEKGKRVALAEEHHLGGSCVNFGCTPTKAVIASARVAHLARRADEFGLKIPKVSVDFPPCSNTPDASCWNPAKVFRKI